MADIVALAGYRAQRQVADAKPLQAKNGSARLLFFTGVRRERMEPLEHAGTRAAERAHPVPGRRRH